MDYSFNMQTVVELPEYIRRAASLLNDSEKQGVINYLASHPQEGTVMQGTGGIRKFRWASGNRGKVVVYELFIIFIVSRRLYFC